MQGTRTGKDSTAAHSDSPIDIWHRADLSSLESASGNNCETVFSLEAARQFQRGQQIGAQSTQRKATKELRDEERLRRTLVRRVQAVERAEAQLRRMTKEMGRLAAVVTDATRALEALAAGEAALGAKGQERERLIAEMCRSVLSALESLALVHVEGLLGVDELHDASDCETDPALMRSASDKA